MRHLFNIPRKVLHVEIELFITYFDVVTPPLAPWSFLWPQPPKSCVPFYNTQRFPEFRLLAKV